MYGGEDRKITLEGENHLVGMVIDRFGTDVMIHPHDQEHFHAGVTVTVSPQFFGWLAGIGRGIRSAGRRMCGRNISSICRALLKAFENIGE